MLPHPRKVGPSGVDPVPVPCNDSPLIAKDSHQPKREHSLESHLTEAGVDGGRIGLPNQLRDDDAASLHFLVHRPGMEIAPVE